MSLPQWTQPTTRARLRIGPDASASDTVLHLTRYMWARDTFCQPGMFVLDLGCGTGFGVALLLADWAPPRLTPSVHRVFGLG
jgi:hypothetical protein